MKKIFSFFILGIFLTSFISAAQIVPNHFTRWNVESTGNESILYDIKSVSYSSICIIPKDVSLKPIVQEEDDLTKPIVQDVKTGDLTTEQTYEKKLVSYSYPSSITMYKETEKSIVSSKSLKNDKELDNSLCFPLNFLESKYYKLGESSIIISAETGYASTDYNITQENLFAHISISDPDVVFYNPFDVNNGSNNITYDYSRFNFNGDVKNETFFNKTGGIIGGAYSYSGKSGYIFLNNLAPYSINVSMGKTIYTNFKTTKNGYLLANEGNCIGWNLQVHNPTGAIQFSFSTGNTGCTNSVFKYINTSYKDFRDNSWYSPIVSVDRNNFNMSLFLYGIINDSEYIDNQNRSYGSQRKIGTDWDLGTNSFNGTIDLTIVINASRSSENISAINEGTYPFFYNSGQMVFEHLNFGTNNKVNISLFDCQTYNGTSLEAKINDGSYANFVDCNITGYDITGNLTNAKLTIKLNSNAYGFYSPVIIGNITLDEWSVDPEAPTFSSVITNNTVAGLLTLFSILVNDNLALHPNGNYTFSTNNTGEWINDSIVNFASTPQLVGVSKVLNSTYELTIAYRWYLTDNFGNKADTGIYYLTTTYPLWMNPHPFSGNRNCFAYNYLKPVGNCTR